MKETLPLILLSGFFVILLTDCNKTQPALKNNQSSVASQATVETAADKTSAVKNNSTNIVNTNSKKDNKATSVEKSQKSNSFECVRTKPEPIIKKTIFSKTNFKLEKNKEFPFQDVGFETVNFSNGDKLVIENTGCENYTLIFRFETSRFSGSPDNVRFWYEKAILLVNQTKKGVRATDLNLIVRGINALSLYMKKNKRLKYEEFLDFGGTEIRDSVALKKVKRLKLNKFQVELSFGVGPL